MSNSCRLTAPCKHCPFRTDIPAYLTAERVEEIQYSLIRSEFPCHETTQHDEEGEVMSTGSEMHCAGALILLEKLEQPSRASSRWTHLSSIALKT